MPVSSPRTAREARENGRVRSGAPWAAYYFRALAEKRRMTRASVKKDLAIQWWRGQDLNL